MSRTVFWLTRALLMGFIFLPILVVSMLAWYGNVRDQCEALGGTLMMSQPLAPVCVKLERIPLT